MADRTRQADRGLTADIDINALNADGDGIAVYRGRPLVVPGTIAGERVRVALIARRSGWTGRLIEVLRPSPHRIEPACPHFGPCGGCSWQHIAYDEQLRIKSAMLTDIIRAAVPSAPSSRPTLPSVPLSAPWGYRQKVHFIFGGGSRADRGRLQMGHYARGSRDIVPVRECPVHDSRGNALAFALYERFRAAGVLAARARPGRTRRTPSTSGVATLKSVAIRVGHATKEMLATLVVDNDSDRRLRTATRGVLDSRTDITGFHLNLHPRDDGFIYGAETRRIAGDKRLRDEVAGTPFLISPTAFFQTNVQAASILVSLVLEAIPSDASVLDLYAGAGLFAIPLARTGRRVVAVEEHRGAVEDFQASVRLNQLPADRCRVIAQPVETAIRSLSAGDAVVLDPPREGCSPGVAHAIFGTLGPKVVVYVSCNPETLARDLAHAGARGYQVRSIQPVDMFPHTAHIESVVVLSR